MNVLPTPPVIWQETRTPEGKVYYFNTITKATQWDKPIELQTPQDRVLASLPWRESTAPDGRKYYYHAQTKQTTWTMPEEYKTALAATQPPVRPAAQAPTFVAGGSTALSAYNPDPVRESYDRRESDRNFSGTNGIHIPSTVKEAIPDYSSFEEAEAAYMKLLKKANVHPDWTWEQTMRATISDPQYRALKDPKDRKAAFEKYAVEVRLQEKEKAKERLAKLRTDFNNMLRSHPEIKHYSRWKTVRPIIERETIFRSTDDEYERKQLFEEYIVELKKTNMESEAITRKTAMTDLVSILKALDLEPYTRWSEAQAKIQENERFQKEDEFKTLSKSDVLAAFENHIKSLERTFNDARQQQKASKARRERQHRDQYTELLHQLRSQGKIKAGTKWMDLLPQIEMDSRYVAMLGQAGSTPLDLFWDVVEEEERALRGKRNDVYDVLEDQRYEVSEKTNFDHFLNVMMADRRTKAIHEDELKLIFDRLFEKVVKRNEEEKHAADRHQRRAVDALRSRIKHLEPPIRISDSWEQVLLRVEKYEEYRALDTDELRKSAFDKVMKRLKEKDEDAEKDRERRRSRRDDDREYRNGDRREVRHRGSKTPEVDIYEAERRKAMADREKQYRKANPLGLSPPRERPRSRDRRDDRHGRLERDAPVRSVSGYDRERRDREDERERSYRPRGDARPSRDELNYGEVGSIAGSERRRRRGGESDGESVESGRRSAKRYRRDRKESSRERERKRTRSPVPTKTIVPEPEPAGVHSGSEEGEIEED
jgi:pre-mRNA-processing factor 40